ncbi:hypothetical protein GCM10010346_23360 [Streptomyces chryseus]|uniref:Uncharacterized protein n=1 Tax=Streptomyces chryseus TaxID=68186 RepID=A0ABQ3DKM6_9ACTN|nr:hypothetical protein GCM10010346_23360 [Streptomyces chryseus]
MVGASLAGLYAARALRAQGYDGRLVIVGVVVVGIGAVPATRWLEGSALALDDGVLCDDGGVTALPQVVAAVTVKLRRPPPLLPHLPGGGAAACTHGRPAATRRARVRAPGSPAA